MSSTDDPFTPSYQVSQLKRGLNSRHREAMRRLAAGQPIAKVAEDLGYTVNRLSVVVNSPLFKKEMARMQERLDQINYNTLAELRKLHPACVQGMNDLVTQTKLPGLRLAAIKDTFDRTGVVASKHIQSIEVQSYEQKLAEVRAKYTVTTPSIPETSPIEVIGGTELLFEESKPDVK